ncbi:MAG TPA: cyclic nucleotide-binding domain-containing protein [Candidatus Limnocylindrales bacterium]|jgi:CRP-like cAMP-binding protein
MSDTHVEWTHQPTATGGQRTRRRGRAERMELLGRVPLFRDLAKTHLRQIADISGSRHVRAGERLVQQGAPGSVFFVIVEGTARVVRGTRTLGRLGPGDFVGEMSILTGAPRTASVVAQTPVECLTLSASNLRAVLRREPVIAMRMLECLAERLTEVDRSLSA